MSGPGSTYTDRSPTASATLVQADRSESAGALALARSHREPALDAVKGLAAVVIMLHHLSLYGPLGQALEQAWPEASRWAARYGRYAVQIFLVLGGYLAAQSLLKRPLKSGREWLSAVVQRWWRLAAPFMVAVALTLLAHAATARWVPELLPQDISAGQLLAHAALMHDIVGVEVLTVGAWYVAIDFQLFAMLGLLLGAGSPRFSVRLRWIVLMGLVCASLWTFNRHARLDYLAVYFFGSFGLGVAVAGMQRWSFDSWRWRASAAGLALVLLIALALEWRVRLLWAAGTLLGLLALQCWRSRVVASPSRFWGFLGERAYALFLVHFAVGLCANAAFVMLDGQAQDKNLVASLLLLACGVSLGLADLFYRCVERPAHRASWAWQARAGVRPASSIDSR